MNWIRKLKWNLLLIKMEISRGMAALVVLLLVVLAVCFAFNYGVGSLENSWQDKEAVKWNLEHHRR